jgi:molybdenum cofactor cytidylyltransferase
MPNGALLILAAGNSSRLGQSKQLVKTSKGQTLLNEAIDIATASQLGEVYVILGSDYKKHSASINSTVQVIENSNWSSGMGSSLKVGLSRAISDNSALHFIIISVCDQPHLQTENLLNLYQKFETADKPIVASRYMEGFGVPVLFSSELFGDLLQLGDSEGALKLLKANLDKVEFVDFEKGNIDIDTPDDLLNHLSN